jgi:hypothetical protein
VSTSVAVVGVSPGVAKLIFSLDGEYLLTDYEAPYTFVLPTQVMADGPLRLSAVASMRDGFSTAATSVDLVLANGNPVAPPNTATFSPSVGNPAGPGEPFVVAVAGDSAAGRIEGDQVVDLIRGWDPNLMLYLGDVYEDGTYTEFYNWYGHGDRWSTFRPITNPTRGNHETSGGVASGYDYYWDNPPEAFSFDAGGWHFISLDVHDTESFDAQQRSWLLSDLAADPSVCTVAYFHLPVLSLGPLGDNPELDSLWALLADQGVDLVLVGHDHNYQRFTPLDRQLQPSPTGVTEILVGSSGHGIRAVTSSDGRAVAVADTVPTAFGALRLSLNQTGADLRYVNTAGTVLDSGAVACGGGQPDIQPPSSPVVSADPVTGFEVTLTWSPATDATGVSGYRVFRDGALVATTSPAVTGFVDEVDPLTSYTYTVVAFDPAGNPSPPSAPVTVLTPPSPSVVVVPAVDDAYVDATKPTTNYGQASTLRVDTSPLQRSFLRFDIDRLGGPVRSATLRVRPNANHSVGFDVYEVPSDTWSEATITDATAPPLGALIASSGPLTALTTVEIPLGTAIDGAGPHSLALVPRNSTGLPIASGETATPPELVVDTTVPVNGPPLAYDDSATTPAGVTVTIDVVANDTNPEQDALHVASVTQGTGGSTAVDPSGSVSYSPGPGFVGTDTFDYVVSDGHGTDTGSVTVEVTPVDAETTLTASADAYVAANSAITNYGTATDLRVDGSPTTRAFVSFDVPTLPGPVRSATLRLSSLSSHGAGVVVHPVLGSWSEATITSANAPALGPTPVASSGPLTAGATVDLDVTSLVGSGGGRLSMAILPLNNTLLRLSSREGSGPPVLVIETGESVNGPPVAVDDSVSTGVGTPVTVAVLANDTDPDGDPLHVVSAATGTAGTTMVAPDGQAVTYAPGPGSSGIDSFSYTVSDGVSTSTATVTVTVEQLPTEVSLAPTDDGYTSAAKPDVSYGTADQLRLDGSPMQVGYVRFVVPAGFGPGSSAVLRLTSGSNHGAGFQVRSVSSGWTESGLTFASAPAPSSVVLASSGPLTAGATVAIDVSGALTGPGPTAFALVPLNDTALRLSSRESAAPPVLLLSSLG